MDLFSRHYHRWKKNEREVLFSTIRYAPGPESIIAYSLPKVSYAIELSILNKLGVQKRALKDYIVPVTPQNNKEPFVGYSRKTGNFLVFSDFIPELYDKQNNKRLTSEFKMFQCTKTLYTQILNSVLNSSLFFWFFIVNSDARHINKREIDNFPIDLKSLADGSYSDKLLVLSQLLMSSYTDNSKLIKLGDLSIQTIYPRKSKAIIDQIDTVLAQYYGFTTEELDFIINYDIKYRMGGADAD